MLLPQMSEMTHSKLMGYTLRGISVPVERNPDARFGLYN